MDENASDRRQEGEIKLSRGGCALNEQHSGTTQSAFHTDNQMPSCVITSTFAGVSAIFESIIVELQFHLSLTDLLHLRHPVLSWLINVDWPRDSP